MKRLSLIFVALFAILPHKASATHAAGGEIFYRWLHDSTYVVYYHFYRDCKGIPEPSSVDICYSSSCSSLTPGTITLNKMKTGFWGGSNGDEVMNSCSDRPTTCTSDTSTIQGYRSWWYQGTTPGLAACDHWIFSHGESARNNAIVNLQSPGSRNLYVEAMLDNLDARINSSPVFFMSPVPYMCNHEPFSYNLGAVDPDNDSLYFEASIPLDGSGCPPYPTKIPVATGSDSIMMTNSATGQMMFTPRSVGVYAFATRVSEYRFISGTWKMIGQVMRDMSYTVRPCNNIPPSLTLIQSSLVNATYVNGFVNVCAGHPFSFDFYERSANPYSILTTSDNSFLIGDSAVYTNRFTDSVHGHFSWTPPATDTGLKIYAVTVIDSSCTVGVQTSETFSIPVYVSPDTKIVPSKQPSVICKNDSIVLSAVGGGNFVWSVLPGGSPLTSLTCTHCSVTVARPDITTSYVVQTPDILNCGTGKDTITVIVPKTVTPLVLLSVTPSVGISTSTPVVFTAATANCGLDPVIDWYKNAKLIKSGTDNSDTLTGLTDGDIIKVTAYSNLPCAIPNSSSATFKVLDVPGLNAEKNIRLYPNPNKGSFTILADLPGVQTADVEIVNTLGQSLYNSILTVNNGKLNDQINLPDLPNAVYWLRLKTARQSSIIPFTIQK
jgi:hypothetical protein